VSEPLLAVRDLSVEFASDGKVLRAVDGVSFEVGAGKMVGLVGESGCGKSVTALALMRLLSPNAKIAAGSIRYGGRDLVTLDESAMRSLRGDKLAMIFQEPMTSLNPVYPTGDQVSESLRIHRGLSRKAARDEAVALFRRVGIADPERRAGEYPHQMSGGMRQRVMIAMALACKPDLLIADEPTTALDVTIQAQILELIAGLSREYGMSVLLITHDLGVVAESCDEVLVMYAGQVVERAPAAKLFAQPRHPYTAGLLRSVPAFAPVGEARAAGGRRRLDEISGMVPRLDELPSGCRFQDRCAHVQEKCRSEGPSLRAVESDAARLVRCHFPVENAP
jgi:peptide/nickel transport system ATP-binding protein